MKHKLRLILPNNNYLSSFARGMDEFRKEKKNLPTEDQLRLFNNIKDFPVYLEKIVQERKGINLKKSRVQQTIYWAMVGNKFVGLLKLRHKLNKNLLKMGGHIGYSVVLSERMKGYATEMLRQGLLKAKQLGIRKVLVTCNETNIGSKKVIEKNDGILENKVKEKGVSKLRFWIQN